jgi:ribosomal protein S27AE
MTKRTYIADKNFDGLAARWTVPLSKKYYADVFVWNTVDAMCDNAHPRGSRCGFTGCYIGYPYRKKSGLFGEIHLVRDEIGSGYVAHELMHCLYDWMLTLDEYSNQMSEKICYMMSDMVMKFWQEFYDRFKTDGLICPRCGKTFSDFILGNHPDEFWTCPECGVIQHLSCRGPLSNESKPADPNHAVKGRLP